MIDRIDHIVLNCCNIEATASWYEYARLPAADLFEPRRAGPAQICKVAAPGSLDLCFVTEGSLKPVIARLQAAGIPIVAGPAPRSGALGPMMSIYCEDPDGNLIEVSTYARDPVA